MHGPAILARRWMQLAVGTDQITAGCRGVFTMNKICEKLRSENLKGILDHYLSIVLNFHDCSWFIRKIIQIDIKDISPVCNYRLDESKASSD